MKCLSNNKIIQKYECLFAEVDAYFGKTSILTWRFLLFATTHSCTVIHLLLVVIFNTLVCMFVDLTLLQRRQCSNYIWVKISLTFLFPNVCVMQWTNLNSWLFPMDGKSRCSVKMTTLVVLWRRVVLPPFSPNTEKPTSKSAGRLWRRL